MYAETPEEHVNVYLDHRFSILTEFDQKPSQADGAFSFVQSTGTGVRRRGKRGGKHNRLKYEEQRRKWQKSDTGSMDLLHQEPDIVRVSGEDVIPNLQQPPNNTSNIAPQCNSMCSADVIRYQWVPHFGFGSQTSHPALSKTLAEPSPKPITTKDTKLPQTLEPCLTKTQSSPTPLVGNLKELNRDESRFFPMTAFFVTPDLDVQNPDAPELSASSSAEVVVPRKQLPIIATTLEQNAVASTRCRTLTIQKHIPPSSTSNLGAHSSRMASPSPLTNSTPGSNPQIPIPRPGVCSPMSSPFSPLPLTPSATALPALTTSPVLSIIQPLALSPSIVSRPGSMPPRPFQISSQLSSWPVLVPGTSPVVKNWASSKKSNTSSLNVTSPVSCKALSVAESFQQDHKPATVITKPSVRSLDITRESTVRGPVSQLKFPVERPSLLPQSPTKSTIQQDLSDFLEMGHANPCWCSAHKYTDPKSLSLIQTQLITPTSATEEFAVSLKEKFYGQIDSRRSCTFLDSDLDSGLTPSLSDSDFEDLCLISCQDSSNGDEEWTVLFSSEQCKELTANLQPTLGHSSMTSLSSFRSLINTVDSLWPAASAK